MKRTNKPEAPQPNVVMIGCFDTKAKEFEFLRDCLCAQGLNVTSLNTGIRASSCNFAVDISATEVAEAAGHRLEELIDKADRSFALSVMGQGASRIISKLLTKDGIAGIIGMGGGGGTFVTLLAMQAIPTGIPKLCLSTVATKDLSRQVGSKDVTLMNSLVDIAGLNSILKMHMRQAAAALAGMVPIRGVNQDQKKGSIAISMFGNTTPCVERCSTLLSAQGYEVLAFHAVGSGGRTMEALIADGFFDAVMDITTTELADHLCGGICSAGPERLKAAGRIGIPQVIVPGCLDMVNFGHIESVPDHYRTRQLYSWAPDVTLMRTNKKENAMLGTTLADRASEAKGKVAILLPLGGISKMSCRDQPFYNPELDTILFQTIKNQVQDHVRIYELDFHINEDSFASFATNLLLGFLEPDSIH